MSGLDVEYSYYDSICRPILPGMSRHLSATFRPLSENHAEICLGIATGSAAMAA